MKHLFLFQCKVTPSLWQKNEYYVSFYVINNTANGFKLIRNALLKERNKKNKERVLIENVMGIRIPSVNSDHLTSLAYSCNL